MYLVGNAIDIHRISKIKCKIILGGISIPSDYKIIAVSDGDIIFHVISEAIYGALGLGDLGDYFPENKYKKNSLDSKIIMLDALNKLKIHNYKIINIDLSIISEHIYFSKIKNSIKENLKILLNVTRINIKATRWEEDKNIIQANCVILLKEIKNESK
ncbi:MAG: 2-C-methyl-D-erythritol 2,4-cyclodiphosphate synthase [Mycoplasmoidaceae bacterium]